MFDFEIPKGNLSVALKQTVLHFQYTKFLNNIFTNNLKEIIELCENNQSNPLIPELLDIAKKYNTQKSELDNKFFTIREEDI